MTALMNCEAVGQCWCGAVVAAVMERNQRVNSSFKLLLLVLIEWRGGEGYGGDRSRVCEGCRR